MTTVTELSIQTGVHVAPLTVDQYHAMIRSGILPEGAAIELIDGLLLRKDRRDHTGGIMTVGPRHAQVLGQLGDLLHALARSPGGHLRNQLPLTLGGVHEPEPDLAVVHGNRRDYSHRHPGPDDALLVVEVSDSSLVFDRTQKQELYASAGIPAYWIVNLCENVVEVHEQPVPEERRYASRRVVRPGESLPATIGPFHSEIPVDAIFEDA